VKQGPPAAKLRATLVTLAVIAIVFFNSACIKLSQPAQPAVHLSLDVPKPANESAININTASAPELEKLPGVGRGIAQRIVAHREQYGPFRRAEHLMMVRGISDRKFRQLRTMIVVE
jgi:competence ComEA-like helix-hairpin-helix protein